MEIVEPRATSVAKLANLEVACIVHSNILYSVLCSLVTNDVAHICYS